MIRPLRGGPLNCVLVRSYLPSWGGGDLWLFKVKSSSNFISVKVKNMRQLKKCTLCPAITKQPVRHINKVHKDHPARYKSTPLQFKYTQVHEICVHLSNNQILYCTVYSSSSTPLPTTWGENLEQIFFFFLLIRCLFFAMFYSFII